MAAGEIIAIDSEGGAGGDARAIGGRDDERVEPAHFLFEDADRGVHRIVAQRIGADEFREVRSAMSFGHFDRAHLDEAHADASARELPCGFAAGESGSDDGYLWIVHGVDGAKVIVAVFGVGVNRGT